jgi:hypothetical protein
LVLGIETGRDQILSTNYLDFLDLMENYRKTNELNLDFTISSE